MIIIMETEIPIWERYALTIKEAAAYYHIGEDKLRNIIKTYPDENFSLQISSKCLIKRKQFEEFLDNSTTI